MVPITTFYSWPLTDAKSNFVIVVVTSTSPATDTPLYWATMPQKDVPYFIENPDPLERKLLPSDYSLPVNFLYDVLDVCSYNYNNLLLIIPVCCRLPQIRLHTYS